MINPLAVAINEVLKGHYPHRGMQVSRGATCECGYWTGTEEAGKNRPAGVQGDQLNWHRASLIAEFLDGETE